MDSEVSFYCISYCSLINANCCGLFWCQVSPLPELIAEPTGARSMSFVGTHEYLAPEIIKGEELVFIVHDGWKGPTLD